MSRVLIKICGIQVLEEAKTVIEGGVDFVGFQFITFAKRKITLEKAFKIIKQLPSSIRCVGVFVDENPKIVNKIATECHLTYVQLQGSESPQYCKLIKFPIIKGFEVREELDLSIFKPYEKVVDKFLLDTPHDSLRDPKKTFNFGIAIEACKKYEIMIAGGLSAENIGRAIKLLHPWGVDVSGSVREDEKINLEKVKEFVRTVRKVETK